MTRRLFWTALILCASCSPASRQFQLRGQVVSIDPGRQELTIKHDAIEGYMAAMTMSFRVAEERLLEGRTLGELVEGTLIVTDTDAYLARVSHIGQAPIGPAVGQPPASSGFELLKPGEPLPDITLTDHLGRSLETSALQGRAVVLTFIYTRCPLPTFCPAMDRHFATIQRTIAADDWLRGRVQLLSVSFDPAYDTPAVLRDHAERLAADPDVWRFVTGDRDEVDRFAARFGVMLVRAEQDPSDITHNLRTAVMDARGRLMKIYTGNEWTPADVIKDLRTAVGAG